ncbi:MAG TPA: PH domain-containing protein [Woeseiaceae bacterium]|nr:PH domain-containing protein [Woeseiaceae bacterium]
MLSNAEIAPADLPAVDAVAWRPLDRRYARRLQVGAVLNACVIGAGLLVLHGVEWQTGKDLPLWPGWAALAVIAASGLVWPLLSVPRKAWAVRERDVLYRSGLLWRTVSAVPFNRIQHVETESTPLDRRFGLASLKLYTAGGTAGDLRIHGLTADVAERMRVFVLERAGAAVERG